MGVRDMIMRRAASSLRIVWAISVRMVPGPIALTRMPLSASERAITRVSWLMPPLETL